MASRLSGRILMAWNAPAESSVVKILDPLNFCKLLSMRESGKESFTLASFGCLDFPAQLVGPLLSDGDKGGAPFRQVGSMMPAAGQSSSWRRRSASCMWLSGRTCALWGTAPGFNLMLMEEVGGSTVRIAQEELDHALMDAQVLRQQMSQGADSG